MKQTIVFAFVFAMLTGCVSYNGRTVDADDRVDEANQVYAQQAQKAFVARMKAPARPVVVTEAPEMGIFLDVSRSPFGGHPLCNNLDVRKEVAVAFKSQLRDKVSGIKDFKLVEEAQAMVAVGDEVTSSANYRMTYNITSLELKENAAGSLATGLTGAALGGRAGHLVAEQKFWDGVAKVEVRLFKPDGTTPVFSFVGEGVYNKMVDAYSPLDKTFLLEAVKIAANNAMDGYVRKFGPPIFVADTCQGGQFARLNVGSKFGVQAGQRVEFFRNRMRKGLSGEDEVSQVVIGNGVVGGKNAPVDSEGAWVFVEDFDANNRSVFRWTSARILPSVK
ncbi:MAG: hypothetical protein ACI4R9_00715 [Kiritimatiellia bacterium]